MSTVAGRVLTTARVVGVGGAAGRRSSVGWMSASIGGATTTATTTTTTATATGPASLPPHRRSRRAATGAGGAGRASGACTGGRRKHRNDVRDIVTSSAAAGLGTGAGAGATEKNEEGGADSSSSTSSPVDPNDARFAVELEVLAVRAPRRDVGSLMAILKKHTFTRPRMHKVVHLDDDPEQHPQRGREEGNDPGGERERVAESLILLDEASCSPSTPLADLPPQVARALGQVAGDAGDSAAAAAAAAARVAAGDGEAIGGPRLVTHVVRMGYPELSAEEALRRMLPPDVTVPTGFEIVGRIVHLNLRAEHEPHKAAVAAVLLDKLPQIRTVVNKIAETGGAYRTFAMEVLAGEGGDVLDTEVNENGLVYELDFRAVYWNSRLGTERGRLVDSFSPEDVVLDLCCGVGPIALPAARKCVAVYANDLNPEAVKYLRLNERRNNAKRGFLLAGATCMDARECVAMRVAMAAGAEGTGAREVVDGGWDRDADTAARKEKRVGPKTVTPPPLRFTQAVMNLPQGSLGLLDCFVGVFDRETWPVEALPRINAYAFSKAKDPEKDVGAAAAAALGLEPDAAALGDGVTYRRVRLVAPGKYMMLISFLLPEAAAYK